MRRARVLFSAPLLHELMHMPASARIIGATFDPFTNNVAFVIEDDELPESDDIIDANPTMTRERVRWEWNL